MYKFILVSLLLASPAFADQAAYVKLGDIKGETEDAAAPVIDNEEQSAEEVKDAAVVSGEGTTGQARRRADVTMKDVSVESKRSDTANTKAQDYNSSRSNRRGARAKEILKDGADGKRDAATGLPTGKRQHRKLDEDSDDDGVLTKEVCDAVDNDCDDARAKDKTK